MKLKIDNYPSRMLVFVFLLIGTVAFGQNRTITGTITDAETGEPLIGASVLVHGTTTGTATDIDGTYTISFPESTPVFFVSYTGYDTKEISLSDNPSNVIDVQMSSGKTLDEVVVIGYGTVKKEDVTGAIQTVNSESFNKGAIASPQDLLAGKVAGVQITRGSGAPGEGSQIRIRGGSSISAGNDPLIVIDGVPINDNGVSGSRNILGVLNPADIESFTVLKDASATAIYGSRASNGVILITTKQGSLNTPLRVDVSTNVSFSEAIDQVDVFSADEFRDLINEQFTDGHPARGLLGNSDTYWPDQIFETALGNEFNVSISGGAWDFLPYRFSYGYTDQEGILKTDGYDRSTMSANLSPGFFDNTLQVKAGIKYMNTNNRFANRGAIGTALAFDPTQPVYDDTNPFGGYWSWVVFDSLNQEFRPVGLSPANPLSLIEQRYDISSVNRTIYTGTVDYRFWFLPELRANLNVAYDRSEGSGKSATPANASFSFDPQFGGGHRSNYSQTRTNELLEFYLNYVNDFGPHKIDLMGGYSWQRFFEDSESFSSDIAGSVGKTNESVFQSELFLLSLFGRLNYSFQDKLLVTLTMRGDASSRFSPDTRWGYFPAAAVAYKILDDRPGTLNNLKLRLGYGSTGQQNVGGHYIYIPTYTFGQPNAAYQFGDELVITLRPEEYNEVIQWEVTDTYNAGIDFGLFNNKLTGSLEYYIRNTDQLLLFAQVAAGANLSNFLDQNVSNMENKGFELTLNATPVMTEKFQWDVGLNFTRNKNEITQILKSDDPNFLGILTGGIAGGVGSTIQIQSKGNPVNSFFVFEQVYGNDGLPIEDLYVDRNGDGVVNSDDMYQYKNPAPDWFMGFNTNISLGNFNVSAAGRANIGSYVYNNNQSTGAAYSNLYHPNNFLINIPTSVNEVQFQNPRFFSDHFVQDGSFFRLDYVSASYRFDNVFDGKGGLTLSATMQNPLLITDYIGLDPEVQNGIDNNIYPRTRTFVFGLNASF